MNTAHTLELVSHPLCPFTQACRLALTKAGWQDTSYSMTYVDLAALPEWFAEISPHNDMPVVRIDGAVRGYDARAFVEWVAEASGRAGESLVSSDPVIRMQQREWARRTDVTLDTLKDIFIAGTEAAVEEAITAVVAVLAPMERALAAAHPAFGQECFSIADAATAPFFSLALFYPAVKERLSAKVPRSVEYGMRLLEDPAVLASRCDDYAKEFDHFFGIFGSYFPKWENVQRTTTG